VAQKHIFHNLDARTEGGGGFQLYVFGRHSSLSIQKRPNLPLRHFIIFSCLQTFVSSFENVIAFPTHSYEKPAVKHTISPTAVGGHFTLAYCRTPTWLTMSFLTRDHPRFTLYSRYSLANRTELSHTISFQQGHKPIFDTT
jgi:hypothetical protein